MSNRHKTIFVGKISRKTSKIDLENEFSKFGRVIEISKFSGYAFLVSIRQTYESEKDAEEALLNMNGKELDGETITVEFSKTVFSLGFQKESINLSSKEKS